MKTLAEKLDPKGPKRILALDGGGIRGALTMGYLKHIEDSLRKQHKNDELLLADYFDLIGGTSTGSIIAAALAIGCQWMKSSRSISSWAQKSSVRNTNGIGFSN